MAKKIVCIFMLLPLWCALFLIRCAPTVNNGFDGGGFSQLIVTIDGEVIDHDDVFELLNSVPTYTTKETEVMIENGGDATLVIPRDKIFIKDSNSPVGFPFFELSGQLIDDLQIGPVEIKSKETKRFFVRFTPLDEQDRYAEIVIESEDPTYPSFEFMFSGKGQHTNSEMKVGFLEPETLTHRNGDTVDFSQYPADTGGWMRIRFRIDNPGSKELQLSGNPKVKLLDNDYLMFEVTEQPDEEFISPGGFPEFCTIIFRPTAEGNKQVNIQIENNDPDNSPYTWTMYCHCSGGEDEVKGKLTLSDSGTLDSPATCTVAVATEISDQPDYQIEINLANQTQEFDFELVGIPDGTYYIWACVDTNGNDILGDPGDFLGIWDNIDPNTNGPNAEIKNGMRSGYNFDLVECTSQTFDDPFNDVAGGLDLEYLDIDEATLGVNWYLVYGSLTLRNIPDSLLFDKAGIIPGDFLEYLWEVVIDMNENGSIDEGDYTLSMLNFRFVGETDVYIDRDNIVLPINTQQTVFKRNASAGSGDIVCLMNAHLSGEKTFEFFVLKSKDAELANITADAEVLASTYYLDNASGNSYSDY